MNTISWYLNRRNRAFSLAGLLVALISETSAGQYVVAWGDDRSGQLSVPPGLTNAVNVTAAETSLALCLDGTVVGWGVDYPGTSVIPASLTDVAAMDAGEYHTLVLKNNGTVLAWGQNTWGQTNVPAGATNIMAVSAGWGSSLALSSNGQVFAWGYSASAPPGLKDVAAISAGDGHNLALRSNGTVVAWGTNRAGQTNVPAGLSDVVAISAGASHSLALRSNHTIAAWGDNSYYQIDIPSQLTNVVAVAAGETFSLAIKSDGTLAAWGHPYYTSQVPPGLTNVVAIAAGRFHSLAVVHVDGGSPVITRQPSARYVYSGMPAHFEIGAEGNSPISYQWRFGGTDLNGATNCSLMLPAVQRSDAGVYQAVVSNAWGSAVSIAADLTVVDSRPYIDIAPEGKPIFVGTDYTLSVGVVGSWPLSYQWRINGTDIPGATNSSTLVSRARLTDSGSYDVVVTNSFGSVTSAVAVVNVYDLAIALNSNLVWTTSGDAPWFGEIQYPPYFTPAARSGPLTNSQCSVIQTSVNGPGELTFQWRVSSQPVADYLKFSINGAEHERISGSVDWRTETFYLGAGVQNLQWTYIKGAFGGTGQDSGWLDWVDYTSGATLPGFTTQPSNQALLPGSDVTFRVVAFGSPPLRYQWQFNGADLTGATNSSLTLLNVQYDNAGSYRAVVSSPYGSIASSDALLFTFVGPVQPQDQLDRWYFRATNQINRVRFAGGLFIGLGNNGTLLTSPDGAIWTARDTGTHASLRGVAYGAVPQGLFVAVGSGGAILTSADGITWAAGSITSQNLNDVAWNGTRFVVTTTAVSVGQPNVIFSLNGTNWSGALFSNNPDSGSPFETTAIATAGGYFVTAGGSQFAYYIWRSLNGSIWNSVGFSDAVVQGIASGNSSTIVVGWEGWPRVSTNNGASWFAIASDVISSDPMRRVGSDICFGNGLFLIPRGYVSGFLTTSDGINWIKRDFFPGFPIDSVAYGKGTFVAVCWGGAFPAGIYQSAPAAIPILTAELQANPKAVILDVSGEIGRSYLLQTSRDLQNWTDRASYINTNSTIHLVDPISSAEPFLFYRSISP